MYYRVHEALGEKITRPDLVIYLQADTEVLMQRIAMRDRPYERQMEVGYIDTLNKNYDAHFTNYPTGNVLTINSNELNYVQSPKDLALVANRIREALRLAPFQESLPIDL